MEITRYDGTRFITEEDVDREFAGKWVLMRVEDERAVLARKGYLVASAEGRDELRSELEGIANMEYDSMATILYGCETRGDCLHAELLD